MDIGRRCAAGLFDLNLELVAREVWLQTYKSGVAGREIAICRSSF